VKDSERTHRKNRFALQELNLPRSAVELGRNPACFGNDGFFFFASVSQDKLLRILYTLEFFCGSLVFLEIESNDGVRIAEVSTVALRLIVQTVFERVPWLGFAPFLIDFNRTVFGNGRNL
jgi:hypothetical protein